MLEQIRVAIMKRIHTKRDEAKSWKGEFGPRIMLKLQENKDESCEFYVDWNGGGAFEVRHVEKDLGHTVYLSNMSCSCRAWDLTGIPCAHAICAINHKRENIVAYVDEWYRKETYAKTYEPLLEPVKSYQYWPQTGLQPVQPPAMRTLPGRPKVNRIKHPLEPQKTGKLSRKGRVMSCTKCGGEGHNKQTCRNKERNVRLSGSDNVHKQDKGKGKSKEGEGRGNDKGKEKEGRGNGKGKEKEARGNGKGKEKEARGNGKNKEKEGSGNSKGKKKDGSGNGKDKEKEGSGNGKGKEKVAGKRKNDFGAGTDKKRKRWFGSGLYINKETRYTVLTGCGYNRVISAGNKSQRNKGNSHQGGTSGGTSHATTSQRRHA